MRKWLVLGLVAVLVVAWYFDLGQWLTLDAAKDQQAELRAALKSSPIVGTFIFLGLYIVVTALSIPGAAILTLLAGALFGLVWGTIVVSFASTIGATSAFLIARYLLRDTVNKRFGHRLSALNQGIAREGGFYLFTLRLVPIFPFFMINLLMGLTTIKTWTFYWVSQVGMLAGTIVYVHAGTQLSAINNLNDLLEPNVLFAFVLLGIFPLIAKKILAFIQRQRAYQGWQKPKRFDRNVVVIGAGAAGLVSSYIAAAVKAKVTLVEKSKMGGDCLNYGCVPSKALIKAAKAHHSIGAARQFGIEVEQPPVDFKAVMNHVHASIQAIEPHDSVERYTDLGVDVVHGHASLRSPWQVDIQYDNGKETTLSTRSVILAAGAAPIVPDLPGLDAVNYWTSDTLWDGLSGRNEAPQRLVILGGGPIGCELAQAFNRLGSDVTLIQRANRLLPREDEDVSDFAREILEGEGVRVLLSHTAVRCETSHGTERIVVHHSGQDIAIEFDDLLCAIGRQARLTGYGLENLGIDTNRTIETNELLATKYPNIFAAGDVAGPYQFTHTAAHQAWYATVNALFGHLKSFKVDYRVIPAVTFMDPEIARVGLNETEAKANGVAYEVTRYGLDDLDRAITDHDTMGWVKVLTPPGSDRILGATIVGSRAGDMLAEFVLAMRYKLGLNKVLGTIHPYPTYAEANKFAAGEWKKKNAPKALLRLVERYHGWRRQDSVASAEQRSTNPTNA